MTKRASVSAYRTEGGLEPLLSVEHRVQWAALAYGCSTKVTAFPGCCRARHRAVRSCAIPAGTPSSIRFRTWRSDAAKSPGHVDRRQDARADVPRTVPGTRADGHADHGSSLQIDDQLQPGRKLHRQVARASFSFVSAFCLCPPTAGATDPPWPECRPRSPRSAPFARPRATAASAACR